MLNANRATTPTELEMIANAEAYERLTSSEKQTMAQAGLVQDAEEKKSFQHSCDQFWMQSNEPPCKNPAAGAQQTMTTTAGVVHPQPKSLFASSVVPKPPSGVLETPGSSSKKRSRKQASVSGEFGACIGRAGCTWGDGIVVGPLLEPGGAGLVDRGPGAGQAGLERRYRPAGYSEPGGAGL